ncbi:MAG: dephospho-CoA kinase [Planctomycetota bacterium]|jgi:dephospho-CoA kinase
MPPAAADSAAAPAPFRPVPPVVLGVLGGIAAGKSAVAARFAAHGLRHVDADQIARAISADPAVVAAVASALGPTAVRDGQLDRQALGARVFGDEAARRALEGILHPRIRAEVLAAVAAAVARGESVLLDVPLLLENGLIDACHATVFLDASLATRRARAAARGWGDGELERREAAQAPLAQKRARARFVIDTDGDLPTMHRGVAAVLEQLRREHP